MQTESKQVEYKHDCWENALLNIAAMTGLAFAIYDSAVTVRSLESFQILFSNSY